MGILGTHKEYKVGKRTFKRKNLAIGYAKRKGIKRIKQITYDVTFSRR